MSTKAPSKRDLARTFIEALPHCRALEMTLDDVSDGDFFGVTTEAISTAWSTGTIDQTVLT